MKKIFVLMASAAVLFAACNKMEEVNTPVVDTPVETETITVVLNPVTKTSLDGMDTKWSDNDAVDVIYGGEKVGTLTHKGNSVFEGELTTVGLKGDATLHYPAGVYAVPETQAAVAGSFANGAALLEGETTIEDLRAGNGASLQNKTALLQFKVAQAGNVTFEVGTTKYTVTGCKTGNTYYACVAPTTAAFTARIDGYLSKKASKNVTFTANKIANLGTLPTPVIRLYIQSEYTHFDMNIYAWGIDGVSLPSSWPGEPMNWDENESMYYYDFPYGIKGKKLNYIINNTVYQTSDLTATISNPEYEDTNNVNWHWIYFKPSTNWKESDAWFAAWFNKDGGEYWIKSIGPDKNGVYGFVQPSTYTNVEFERMNPASNEMNWDNKWNSTANQTIPTNDNNYFKCTEGWWNAHNDPWTKYSLPN